MKRKNNIFPSKDDKTPLIIKELRNAQRLAEQNNDLIEAAKISLEIIMKEKELE